MHQVVPTFGVQTARFPDLGGGPQPGQIDEIPASTRGKGASRIPPKSKLGTSRQDCKVRSGEAWESNGGILTEEARR